MSCPPVRLLFVTVVLLLALISAGPSSRSDAVQPAWDLGSPAGTDRFQPRGTASANGLPGRGWATQVAAGYQHTCALTVTGGVKCWGDNSHGQLGDGTTQQHFMPVGVVGLTSGVRALATGGFHTCAVTAAGGVKCWGANDFGQLGDGTATQRLTPVDVVDLSDGISAIAAGGGYTCALSENGRAKCWGHNGAGQLGDGTQANRLTPGDVVGLNAGPQGLSTSSYYHTCAVTAGNGAKCWGNNFEGQLGDGTTSRRLTPVDVAGLQSGVRVISAGSEHTCAVLETGAAKCWGADPYGQLGIGLWQYPYPMAPADVVGLQSGVATIRAGGYHTCAVLENGGAKCWGNNERGQLGDSTTRQQQRTPTDVVGLQSSVGSISTGFRHTCAVTDVGAVKCWGENRYGQLGDGTTTNRRTPVDVLTLVFDCAGVTAIPPTECAALVALFDYTQGMLWRERTGWLQAPDPCAWQGVTCTADPSRQQATCPDQGIPCPAGQTVSALNLPANGLNGALPAALGDLTALQILDLSHNRLSGPLPPELGDLSALQHLDLSGNRLGGPLPAELGRLTALQTLNLSHNFLSGAVPPELGDLAALQELRLNHTELRQLPAELGRLAHLQYLDLSHTALGAPTIPAELADLASLRHLDLSHAGFYAATIPPELGRLAHLRYLALAGNGLSGPLPAELGRLTALQTLALSENGLSGPLPAEWGQMSALQGLDLSTNQLSGPLPAAWGQMSALQWLSVARNQLSGPLPAAWGQMTALRGLDLSYNQLSGSLPAAWGNLTALQWLSTTRNQLSGPLPSPWGALTALWTLDLSHNQLLGPLPAEWGQWTALRYLLLQDNQLSGPLPAEWGNLTAVVYLRLSNNHLSGPLPPEWGNLRSVRDLLLDNNHLSGSIPPEWGNLAAFGGGGPANAPQGAGRPSPVGVPLTASQTPDRPAMPWPDTGYLDLSCKSCPVNPVPNLRCVPQALCRHRIFMRRGAAAGMGACPVLQSAQRAAAGRTHAADRRECAGSGGQPAQRAVRGGVA